MTTQILAPDLLELLRKNDLASLQEFCSNEHPRSVADHLSALSPKDIWRVLHNLDAELAAEIFSHFDDDLQIEIADTLSQGDLVELITEMPPDERADLFKQIPVERQEKILRALAQAEREDIRRLAAYEEGTAGAVMTSDYASLPPQITAGEAIERLRHEAPDKETIYYAYVVDQARRLLGFISLKDLILADPNTPLEEIMHREVISVRVDDDQEDAARKIQKYDLIALPVINGSDALVGIITHDDALDVITQEQTEDMEKMMAIGGSHEAGVYLGTSAWTHFKNRAAWIVGLAALEVVSGWIIHSYEATLSHLMILALYMPMVADTGGNTGSQSGTVVIRALALHEISPKDLFKVLFKELKISLLLAAVLGVLSAGKVLFLSHSSVIPSGFNLMRIAEVIGVALAAQVVTATLVGALLPMGAAKLKLDPAVVASPALTTVVDITGLLIYFTTAKLMLGI